jgi:hypothetical protein
MARFAGQDRAIRQRMVISAFAIGAKYRHERNHHP